MSLFETRDHSTFQIASGTVWFSVDQNQQRLDPSEDADADRLCLCVSVTLTARRSTRTRFWRLGGRSSWTHSSRRRTDATSEVRITSESTRTDSQMLPYAITCERNMMTYVSLEHKTVKSSTGICVAIANNTLCGSK